LATLDEAGMLALPSLHSKEFIFPRADTAFADTEEYIFKHAILRDVTYETVLKRTRRTYHALVADWLVQAAEAWNVT
jgi:predicted ATPase